MSYRHKENVIHEETANKSLSTRQIARANERVLVVKRNFVPKDVRTFI